MIFNFRCELLNQLLMHTALLLITPSNANRDKLAQLSTHRVYQNTIDWAVKWALVTIGFADFFRKDLSRSRYVTFAQY